MDKKQRKQLLKGVLSSLFLITSVGWSDERFPNQINNSKTPLKLCSQAELKAFKLIHVGNAGLYLEDCNQVLEVFSLKPKRLRFLYDTPIPAKAFREASVEYLEINLGEKFNQWKTAFDNFNSQYQDVKAGDFYDLIYDPLKGLLLQLNGQDLGTLQDPEVALAYLAIWFGNKPFSEDLKETLLK